MVGCNLITSGGLYLRDESAGPAAGHGCVDVLPFSLRLAVGVGLCCPVLLVGNDRGVLFRRRSSVMLPSILRIISAHLASRESSVWSFGRLSAFRPPHTAVVEVRGA